VASVLDRLMDDHPETTKELPKPRGQVLRELKQCVRRDLENLLNTRWRAQPWPKHLDELDRSLVNYGIPDFTGMSFGSTGGQQRLVEMIEQTIRRFEPRFKQVKVELLPATDQPNRTLRFRIDAMLHAEPAPEPVIFDTQLQTSTGQFEITGAAR
jgi:type VI secretion system protein ImpF